MCIRLVLFLFTQLLLVSLAAEVHAGFPDTAGSEGAGLGADSSARKAAFTSISSAAGGKKRYRDDAILVRFKAGTAEGTKDKVHARHGATVLRKFDRLRIHHVKLKKRVSVTDALKEYASDPEVEYAEPDYLAQAAATPSDPYWGSLWGMSKIGAPTAWDVGTGSSQSVVAVIDTGIDYNHPDLAANTWVNPGVNVGYLNDLHGIDTYNNDSDPMDDQYHGTHVSGTIGAAANNGIGVAGLNWNVKLLACKFLGSDGRGYISGAIECLEYLRKLKDAGVNIVASNNSWGADGYSQSLSDAISAQGDILFIAAAGNDARDIDRIFVSPGGYDLPNAITVEATDENDALASFSNRGANSVHVAAPGTNIYSTSPGSGYQYLSGTSMATPHVTGLAALLSSQGKNWKQTRNLILTGAEPVPALSGSSITGRRINASNSVACSNRPFFALRSIPASVQAGVPVTLSAISINCGGAAGPVTASYPGGSVQMHDDGVAPDLIAGDGTFSGTWVPTSSAGVAFSFTSPAGSRSLVMPALAISPTSTVEGPATTSDSVVYSNLGAPFSQTFSAGGGTLPYSWSIAGGELPAGFSLNSVTGRLTGVTSASGIFPYTVQVTDAAGTTASASWNLLVRDLRPGWPVALANPGFPSSSPLFADLDGDGKQELVAAGRFTLNTYRDNGLATTIPFPSGADVLSTPAVADLQGNGQQQIVVSVGWPFSGAPLHVYDKNLNLVPGFPAGGYPSAGSSPGWCGSPVIADFNGDGNRSILVDCTPVDENNSNYLKHILIMVDSHGAQVSGWPVVVGPVQRGDFDPRPVVADIDNDGKKEILLLTSDGMMHVYRKSGAQIAQWLAAPGATAVWTPAVADIDGDGFLDVAVKQNYVAEAYPNLDSHRILAYDRKGNLLPGWPREFLPKIEPGKAVVTVTWGTGGIYAADLNGDGRAEVITNLAPSYYVWVALQPDGSMVENWPLPDVFIDYNSHLVLGEIDGSGSQGVVFYSAPYLYGYHGSGTLIQGYPKPGVYDNGSMQNNVSSSPALGDLDGNGRVDIAVKAGDGSILVWESPQASSSPNLQWPLYAHDQQHTGALPVVPGVNFSPSTVFGSAPLQVDFTDTSTTAPVSWSWSFGDGGTSSVRNPSHVYATPGIYTVSLTAIGSDGKSGTKTKSSLVTVVDAPLHVTTTALPAAYNIYNSYNQQLTAVGGFPPYSWSIISGNLPYSLTLDANGVISGTPQALGTSTFTVQVTDATGVTASKELSITVNNYVPISFTAATLPHAITGTEYNNWLTASGGVAPLTWSLTGASGSLPVGIGLNGTTGVISGTPITSGSYRFTVTVTDAIGRISSKTLYLVVDSPTCSIKPFSVAGAGSTFYDDFASAYAATANNDILQLHDATYSGNMYFTKDLSLSIRGGYDCSYSSIGSGAVVVSGKVVARSGKLKIDNLRFK